MGKTWEEHHQETLAQMPSAIKKEPANPVNYILLAFSTEYWLKKPGEAKRLLRKAIRLDPYSSTAYNNLGLSLSNAQRTREAESALREAVRLDPRSSAAYCNLGLLLFRRRHFDEAKQCFRNAIRFASNKAVGHRLSFATMLGAHGFYREAIAQYKKASNIYPENKTIYYWIGELYEKLGNNRWAIRYYEQYLRHIDEPSKILERICHLRKK